MVMRMIPDLDYLKACLSPRDEYVGFKLNRLNELMLVLRVKVDGRYFLVNMTRVQPNFSDLVNKSGKPRIRAGEERPDDIVDEILLVREKSLSTLVSYLPPNI